MNDKICPEPVIMVFVNGLLSTMFVFYLEWNAILRSFAVVAVILIFSETQRQIIINWLLIFSITVWCIIHWSQHSYIFSGNCLFVFGNYWNDYTVFLLNRNLYWKIKQDFNMNMPFCLQCHLHGNIRKIPFNRINLKIINSYTIISIISKMHGVTHLLIQICPFCHISTTVKWYTNREQAHHRFMLHTHRLWSRFSALNFLIQTVREGKGFFYQLNCFILFAKRARWRACASLSSNAIRLKNQM